MKKRRGNLPERTGLSPSRQIFGTIISHGLASGNIHLHARLQGPVELPEIIAKLDADEEIARLDAATLQASDQLLLLAAKVEQHIDSQLSEVFRTHKLILNDTALIDELRTEINENLVSASRAVTRVFFRWEKRFKLMESMIAREKADDLHDISIRLRNALAGIILHPFENLPEQCVLVTPRLLPSDTVFLSERSISAVLLENASIGSHAALFTRQIGVPCLAGIPDIMNCFVQGSEVLVDAVRGTITIGPSLSEKQVFDKSRDKYLKEINSYQVDSRKAAMTRDGHQILVQGNIGNFADSERAEKNGADGVGLYRLEQFYIGRTSPPDVEELLAEMRHALLPFKGKSVCIRLLDVGSDKVVPFLQFMSEANPAMGRRGIRILRDYPELLITQLKAILQLLPDWDISVLIPMVTLLEDIITVKSLLAELGQYGDTSRIRLGAMIETPAAALSADILAPHVDFFSFGTNDLTQYTFAADRENPAVVMYFQDSSDVIFRLIALVHQDAPDTPLSLCGELGGRPEQIEKLLQSGIDSLGVSAPLIGKIKASVRQADKVRL